MNRFESKRNVSKQCSLQVQRKRRTLRKRLVIESLEARHLMAGDLGTFLTQGHVDIDIARSGIEWSVGVKDAHAVPETKYANNDAVLYVGATSLIERPDIAQFDFLGVNPGEQFYLLPQSEDPNMLFLGVAAEGVEVSTVDRYSPSLESKGRVSSVSRWVKATLSDVRHTNPDGTSGAGVFSSWRTGVFGQTTVFMSSLNDGVSNPNGNGLDTTDGISADDAWWIQAGTESHVNFGFSKSGRYEVDLRVSAYFGDDTLSTPNIAGLSTSTPVTLFFSVASSGELQFESATYSVNENAGSASVDVIRVGGSVGKLTVDYATSNGSAIAGSDFTSTIGTLTFGDKETRKTIVIPIIHDAALEPTEAFSLALTSPKPADFHSYRQNIEGDVNGLLGGIATATISIVNVENSPPTISDIANRFVVEGNSTGAIPFTVSDVETAAADLLVTATSSNQSVIPNGNIVLAGSGANRTIRLTAIEGQIGVSTITVTVTDAAGLQSSDTFDVSVIATPLVPFALPRVIGNGVAGVSNVNIADLDADGKLDVLAGAYGANKVVWYKGTGDGTFGAERVIDAAAAETWFNTPGDLDGDGDADVLAGMYSGTLAWYANNGSGSFVKNVLATDIVGPYVRIGDLNGDGRNDILAGPDGGTTIFYFQQLPTGGFASRQLLTSSFSKLGGIHLNDFDFDGDLDLFAGDYGSNQLSWFVNNGSGVFGARQFVSAQDSSGLDRVVDLTGDGLVDLLSLEYATGRVSYYPQLTTGGFGGRVAIPLTVADSYALAVADFDNDGDNDIADGAYGSAGMIAWVANQGNGSFKPQLQISTSEGQVSSMVAADVDTDGDADLVVGSFSGGRVSVYKNRLGEFATQVVQPASGVYLLGQKLDASVHFGYPVSVTGTPSISLQIGPQTVQATYLSGSGTPTLKFQYTVQGTDLDSDGVQLAGLLISLNGGSIIDPLGKPVDLALPATPFSGVLVNGNAPFANAITRAGAAHGANTEQVSFLVSFNEAVQDVDAADFNVVTTGTLAGISVASVSGTGASRTVVVNTGIGSGVLGLHLKLNATISDLTGNAIGRGYAGGEVYTIERSPSFVIDNFYTAGHGDVQAALEDNWLELKVTPDGFEYENNEVLIYGNADALTTRPAGARWDFLGVEAGQNLYVWSDNGAILTVPEQGFSGELVPGGTVAAHEITDPRIANTGTYLRLQVVGMRSSEGGAYSVFTNDLASTRVWIATAEGVSSADSIWIQEGSHQHFNVAFSKKGYYEVDFVVSTFRDINGNGVYDQGLDPYIESGLETIYYGVDIAGGPVDYVVPSDNRPVAFGDTYSVAPGNVLRGNVLFNDADLDGDSLNAVVIAGATKGTLTLNGNGGFTYTPGTAFDGSDSFTYRSSDGILQSEVTTVTITGSVRPDFDATLKTGHADIGVNFEDDAWDLHIHDEETDTEYEPDEAMFYVGRDAMLTRTGDAANAAYDFLGAPVGSTLFVLPQVENPNLLFLGIGGEELADGLLEGDKATLRLASVSGPGQFSIWQSGLTPTTPKLVMATSDGIDASDMLDIVAGSHAHMNFAFTKQGFYEVTFVASGVDADGNVTDSGQVTYYFFLTDGLVPFSLPRVVGGGLAGVSNVNVVDLDADGKLDVVAGAYGANKIVWYKGNGDATFGTEQVIDAAAAETWFNTHGDLDGDGDVDVLAGMYSGTLAWYANNGSGSFVKNVLATDIVGPYVRIGDLNGDGRNDILAGPDGGTTIFYFQQLPTGGFASREVLATSFSKLGGIHLNDFDSDGDLDLFAGDYGSNQLSWFVNNGSGVFGARQFISSQDSSGLDRVVDLTGDGRVDLLSLEYATGKVSYYPQLSDGAFGGRVAIPLTVADSYALAVADFDNDGDNDIADGAYGSAGMIAWVANQGNGTFKPQLQVSTGEGQVSSMTTADLDSDGDADLVVGSFSGGRVSVFENRLNEFATEVVQPAGGTYLSGQKLDAAVHFGYPVTVTGTPSIALQIGSQTVQATYLSGSGTPTLTFQYTVQGTDIDSDGVQLAASLISLNGGSIIDPMGQPANLALPSTPFMGVLVNGNAPFANAIARAEAAHGANTAQVSFMVSFNEAVQDVDASDFDLVTTGTLAGTSVVSVGGTGTTRTVVVNTGIGSGVLGLHVKPNATITDLNGNAIGRGYAGGQVYTIQRSPSFVIDNFYAAGHGDVQAAFEENWLELKVTPDGFEYENDEVLIYGSADALTTRPAGARWDFLGVEAGQSLYVWSDNGAILTVPEQGFSGELVPGGTVAAHEIADPRIANTGTYLRLQVIGMRSSEGGAYSVFTNDVASTRVWIATADGISSEDSIWIQEGSHQHFNVAFSKNGYYEVDFVVSSFRDINGNGVYDEGLDPYIESGQETIYYGVDIPGGPVNYVVPSDNRPVAFDDIYTLARENVIRGNVLFNDADLDGDSLNALVVAGVTKGTLTLNGNGSFTYTPGPSFDGSDSFTYRVSDGVLLSEITTVTITGSIRPEFDAVLTMGHADIGVNFEDDAWDLHIHDEETDTEYEPSEALLRVGLDAKLTRTGNAADPAYDFLGVPAGSSLFVLPQVENPNLLFLGIGGEELATGLLSGDKASLRLASVSGPGQFSVWQSGLTPTTPKLIMATSDGIDAADSFDVAAGSHAHVNFAFTKLGFYEVTFVALGIDADGNETDSGQITYYFVVGNEVRELDVQNGLDQRSYIRNLDLVFESDEGLLDLLGTGRIQLTKFDLNGENGVAIANPTMGVVGNTLRFDFGSQGLGGNRNKNAGDGYYRVGIDVDGDGQMDAFKHFYRLLGDVTGDGKVDDLDRLFILKSVGSNNPNADVNGDKVVNGLDSLLASRALGRKLKDGLRVDD